MNRRHAGWLVMLTIMALGAACRRATSPAVLDTANDQCGFCRMIVSDPRSASQIVSPYEEPRFFDDLSCLSNYLAATPLPAASVIYVADHRTKAWVRADEAVFTRLDGPAGAMGSHFIAHTSDGSRAVDAEAVRGVPVDRSVVLPIHVGSGRPQ